MADRMRETKSLADRITRIANQQSGRKPRGKLAGPLFEGNVFRGGGGKGGFTADQFAAARKKFEKGVRKPTALRVVKKGGKEFSQFFFKPIQVGEFTD
jgi:hypothetical protein